MKDKWRVWFTDIEAAEWDQFLFAVVTRKDETQFFDTPQKWGRFFQKMNEHDIVYAHFGGGYDFLALMEAFPRWEWEGSFAGSSLVELRVAGGPRFRDSGRLFPISLSKWTGEKSQTGLDCVCGKKCGGYCAISKNLTKSQYSALLDYCINDCRVLEKHFWKTVHYLQDQGFSMYSQSAEKRGEYPLRKTLGAVAWASIEMQCEVEKNDRQDWGFYNTTREGYSGGKNEVYRVFAEKGFRRDINSAYPHALCGEFGVGTPEFLEGRAALRALASGVYGLFWCDTYQEPGPFVNLPQRAPSGRLIWATGFQRGCWPTIELQTAQQYGTKILSCRQALVWRATKEIYRPFFERMYEIKKTAKMNNDPGMYEITKLLLNAPSGKLAQGPEQQTLLRLDSAVKFCYDYEAKHGREPNLESYSNDFYLLNENSIGGSARPHHAAFVTARIRATVLHESYTHASNAIYCDTDCLYSLSNEGASDETKLGAFKNEGEMYRWRCAAPKIYTYDVETPEKGRVSHFKAKGIPELDADTMRRVLAREPVTVTSGVEKPKSSIKKGDDIFKRRHLTRQLRMPDFMAGTRYVADPNDQTVALHYEAKQGWIWPGVAMRPSEFISDIRGRKMKR